MKQIQQTLISLCIAGTFVCSCCGLHVSADTVPDEENTILQTSAEDMNRTDEIFSKRDLSGSYDIELCTQIELKDEDIEIKEGGVYLLSGSLTNGQVVVCVSKEEKVQLVLDNVSITNSSSAAIYIESADKVFLTMAENSRNTLSVTGPYVNEGEVNIDAVVFARCDLTLNGSGALNVNAEYGHGIVSKKDLVIASGIYKISSETTGLIGEKSVAIADGQFSITAGGGSAQGEMKSSDTMMFGGMNQEREKWFYGEMPNKGSFGNGPREFAQGSMQPPAGGMMPQNPPERGTVPQMPHFEGLPDDGSDHTELQKPSDEEHGSGKGIKSDGMIWIAGGTFDMDTSDDSIHASENITILDGMLTLRTADDGIHSDTQIDITGGTIQIPYCYEGIEAKQIIVSGGLIVIDAHDDGLNASGGSNYPGAVDEDCTIRITGGDITIRSDGDCIDSNGTLIIDDGSFELNCSGNGNSCLDSDGSMDVNGGSIHTNDGSENGSGGFGFGGGRQGNWNRPSF